MFKWHLQKLGKFSWTWNFFEQHHFLSYAKQFSLEMQKWKESENSLQTISGLLLRFLLVDISTFENKNSTFFAKLDSNVFYGDAS